VRNGRDLEGKTIGVASLGSMGWLAINSWVTKNCGDRKALKRVELPFPTAFEAVTAHRVYGAELAYPQLAPALDSKTVKLIPIYSAIAPAYLFSAWMTTKGWAAKNAVAARAFARVMSVASAYANAHHAETVPLLAAFSGMTEAQIQSTVRVAYGVTLNPADLQPVIAAAALGELIKVPFPTQDLMFKPATR
jgi:ABC-type nitrate/sulfonate/bicarbonate transport system substrate-binding protein